MRPNHRIKLRYDSYATSRLRYGATVTDDCQGDVVIVAISNGRIPWPLGASKANPIEP